VARATQQERTYLPKNIIIVSVEDTSHENGERLRMILNADSVTYYGKSAFIVYFKDHKPPKEEIIQRLKTKGVRIHEIRYR